MRKSLRSLNDFWKAQGMKKLALPSHSSIEPAHLTAHDLLASHYPEFTTVYHRLKKAIRTVSQSSGSVLILGPKSSGKETLAVSLWRMNQDRLRPLIICDAEQMKQDQQLSAVFKLANGGDLVLRNLDQRLNSLSRNLSECQRAFPRVRIIGLCHGQSSSAWTHYFPAQIEIPPLSQRRIDISPLIQQLLNHMTPRKFILSEDALRFLTFQEWVGEVSQLKLCIQRSAWEALNRQDYRISKYDVQFAWEETHSDWTDMAFVAEVAQGQLYKLCKKFGIKKIMQEIETSLVAVCLNEQNHNLAQTARVLKLPVNTLFSRCKNYKDKLATQLNQA